MDNNEYSYRDLEADAEFLYNHFLNHRNGRSTEDLLRRFQAVFIDGSSYDAPTVLKALHRLVNSPWAESGFSRTLNLCSYTLINYWSLHHEWDAIGRLIELIEQANQDSSSTPVYSPQHHLLQRFKQSEQFKRLKNRGRVVNPIPPGCHIEIERIEDLISRYPFLYTEYLRSTEGVDTDQSAIHELQTIREKEFGQQLFGYARSLYSSPSSSGRSLNLVIPNPTLLTQKQVQHAVQRFAGKVDGYTCRDLAHLMSNRLLHLTDHRTMKHQMYEYLKEAIRLHHPTYGDHSFNYWLNSCLNDIFLEQDEARPTGLLLLRTCHQFIKTLVDVPRQGQAKSMENHYRFLDLVTNLGATFLVELLLKVVLLCQNSHANLTRLYQSVARQLAGLFKSYECKNRSEELNWLVECLDNWLIASTIHFTHPNHGWSALVSTGPAQVPPTFAHG